MPSLERSTIKVFMPAEDATGLASLRILQGTEDPLADLTLLEPVVARLAPRVRLELVQGGDHGFELPEGSQRTQSEVYEELASAIASFVATLAPQSGG